KWAGGLSVFNRETLRPMAFGLVLFKAIERHVREYEGGGGDDYTDPGDDGMDLPLADAVYFGSKNQRAKVTAPQKRTVEVKPKPVRHTKSEDMEIEECSSEQRVERHTNTFDENTGALDELSSFVSRIGNLTLNLYGIDKWSWVGEASGIFKVKTLTRKIQNLSLNTYALGNHLYWNSWIPRKVNICVCEERLWKGSLREPIFP
nr:RNA-directed DNA polymerase, eukaryota, reverse transcriptase zinc-binding domain protein [Tanacetum cinerariifolium]